MQETPNFQSLKNQFNSISLPVMIDGREKVEEPYRSKVANTYNEVKAYFEDDQFRNSLDLGTKGALEGQIGNIIAQFNQLVSWQNDGSTSIAGQIQSIVTNNDSYMNEFISRRSPFKQLFDLQGGRDISKIVDNAEEKERQASQTVIELTKKLSQADKLLGGVGTNDLADYYQRHADGRTVNELAQRGEIKHKHLSIPGGLKTYLVSILLLHIVIDWTWKFISNLDFSRRQYITLCAAIGLPIAIYLGLRFLNHFNESFKGGFLRTAHSWMVGAIASTVFTAIYATFLVAELGSDAGWQNIVPKLIGLLAPAYFVRFCVQNYRANMHLSIQNGQKATVARVVDSFSDLVRHDNPDYAQQVLVTRSEIISAAAKVVFTPSETGFLTTKEGAGGNDNMLDSIINIKK